MDTNIQLFIFMRPFFFDLYMSFNQKIYLLFLITWQAFSTLHYLSLPALPFYKYSLLDYT